MRKRILTSIAALVTLVVMATMLQSCADDEPYYSYGSVLTSYDWELVEVNGRPIPEIDVCEFRFFDYGDGTYGRYDEYARWYEIPIRWEVSSAYGGADYLYVYPSGTMQRWEYLMRVYGGYPATLELNDLATGDRLIFEAYR